MVYYKGRIKTRAELVKEQLELDRQKAKAKLIQETSINLYPTNESNYILALDRVRKNEFKRHSAYSKLREDVLNELFFQSIYTTMVEPVLEACLANDHQKQLAAATVKDFILEQDSHKLLEQWKYKNFYLAEYAEMIQETYNSILEDSKNKLKEGLSSDDVQKIENYKIDNFVYDANHIIPADIGNEVVNRVETAITDFATDMKDNKNKIMDIYNKAQDKISALDGSDMPQEDIEQMQQEALRVAKREEMVLNESETNMFGMMVRMMTESAMIIPALQETYRGDNGKVNVAKVLGDVRAIYTVLETMNTLDIVDANSEYIGQTLSSMKDSLDYKKQKISTNADDTDKNEGNMYQPKEWGQDDGVTEKRDPTDDFASNY